MITRIIPRIILIILMILYMGALLYYLKAQSVIELKENVLQATTVRVYQYELTLSTISCPPRHNIKKENLSKP